MYDQITVIVTPTNRLGYLLSEQSFDVFCRVYRWGLGISRKKKIITFNQ